MWENRTERIESLNKHTVLGTMKNTKSLRQKKGLRV